MYRSRLLETRVPELLRESPVLVLTGARQTGKSTLLRHLFPEEWIYDLDDLAVLRAFRDRPELALSQVLSEHSGGAIVIDEAQRVPDLLIAVKRVVDSGADHRFVISGSANLTLLASTAESLAGRAQRLELMPFAVSEWQGRGAERLVRILEGGAEALEDLPPVPLRARGDLDALRMQLLRHGSMPPLLERPSPRSRARWLMGYHQTYLERDLRDVGRSVDHLLFARTLELVCHRTSGIVSWSTMGRDLGCSYATVRRYVEVMRLGYQAFLLPAWSGSLARRLVKSPRLYLSDVGVRNQVAGTSEPAGAVYETWVVGEVRKLLTTSGGDARLSWFRTSAGLEADLLIEDERGIVAIEVKARERLARRDATPLRRLAEAFGDRFRLGLVVHPGTRVQDLGDGIFGVPDLLLFDAL
jgi:predicted AAA+ superfamily ATPase